MKFAFFNDQGRVETAHNDDTVSELPPGAVELSDDQWATRLDLLLVGEELTTSPVTPTKEDLASDIRALRNKKLSETDWTQGRDIPDEVASKFAPYRQALRDISLQKGFPSKCKFPEFPK